MRLYDTLRREVTEFIPRHEGEVSIYACGPTVYSHPHLGHARQAITYDIARRYFEWAGYRVRHVANVTDIDDKIINRALEEGSTEPEVAEYWKGIYDGAMEALNVLPPHDQPHATQYVKQMVDFIATLVDNGSAYATDSGVYLRVRSVEDYGALIHRTPDEIAENAIARVESDETKEDPLDFALWKAAKPGEPTWDSPWGPGRPGWHIECAAMSLDILDDDFDIHGGGDDLIFPTTPTSEQKQSLLVAPSLVTGCTTPCSISVARRCPSRSETSRRFKTYSTKTRSTLGHCGCCCYKPTTDRFLRSIRRSSQRCATASVVSIRWLDGLA